MNKICQTYYWRTPDEIVVVSLVVVAQTDRRVHFICGQVVVDELVLVDHVIVASDVTGCVTLIDC